MAISNSGYQSGTTAAPQNARRVLFGIAAQVPATGNPLARATLTTALAGANNDLTYTARFLGTGGNSTTIAYVVAGNNTPLTVSVTGQAITVNVATSAGGAATSTANDIATAIRNNAQATSLVDVQNAAGNDGTGVVTALSVTPLANGVSNTIGRRGNAPLPRVYGSGIPIHNVYGQR